MERKKSIRVMMLCIFLLILLSQLFNKTRIVILTELQNITVNSEVGNWKWDFQNEYVSVYDAYNLPSEIRINLSAEENIRIDKLRLYWGNWLVWDIAPENFMRFMQFDTDFAVGDRTVIFQSDKINIVFSMVEYRKLVKIFRLTILVVLGIMLAILSVLLRRFAKHFRFVLHVLAGKAQSKMHGFNKQLCKRARYLGHCVVCLIIIVVINCFFNLMHSHELFFLCIGYFAVSLIIASYANSGKEFLLCSAIAVIPLFFSVERLTDYLIVDEPRAINEQINLADDILRHWSFGSSRINYAIMGTLLKWVPSSFLKHYNINEYQYAKLLHWLVGMLITIMISRTAAEKCLKNEKMMLINFMIIFCGLLSLSVYLNGLKFYNYDTFSLLLGLLGCLYLYYAIKDQNYKASLLSLCILSLSLLEKMIALPYWCLALLVCTYLCSRAWTNSKKDMIVKPFLTAFLIILLQIVLCFIISEYVAIFLRDSQFPPITFVDTAKPLVGSLISVLGMQDEASIYVVLLLMMLFLVGAMTMLLQMFVADTGRARWLHRIVEKSGCIFADVIVVGWIIGIWFLYVQPTVYIDSVYDNINNLLLQVSWVAVIH